jgi:hypothetical protein
MKFKYEYVIYDLNNYKNERLINNYLIKNSIIPIERFGE